MNPPKKGKEGAKISRLDTVNVFWLRQTQREYQIPVTELQSRLGDACLPVGEREQEEEEEDWKDSLYSHVKI